MKNITTVAELQHAIQISEQDIIIKEHALKTQLLVVHSKLRPVNLLKGILSELSSSPYLGKNILEATAKLVSGYTSKKRIDGASGIEIKKLLVSILQVELTNVVVKHADIIQITCQSIFKHFIYPRNEH